MRAKVKLSCQELLTVVKLLPLDTHLSVYHLKHHFPNAPVFFCFVFYWSVSSSCLPYLLEQKLKKLTKPSWWLPFCCSLVLFAVSRAETASTGKRSSKPGATPSSSRAEPLPLVEVQPQTLNPAIRRSQLNQQGQPAPRGTSSQQETLLLGKRHHNELLVCVCVGALEGSLIAHLC